MSYRSSARIWARKTANESTTLGSTTLQNDDELSVAVIANAVYFFECLLFADGSTTGDIKYAFTVPSGATLYASAQNAASTAAGNGASSIIFGIEGSGTTGSGGLIGIGTKMPTVIRGTLVVGGTAGTLQLQWAPNGADGSNATTVYAGSLLCLERIA